MSDMLHVFFKTLAIFVIMAFGFGLRRRGTIDAAFNRQLSRVLVQVLYPALIFSSLSRHFTWSSLVTNWPLPAGSAMIMLIGWSVGRMLRPLLHREPPRTAGMFHFQCMMNNYSFLPIMLASALLGETAVSRIIFSTLGAEILVWTLGVRTLTGRPVSPRETVQHLLSLPMLAMAAGAGWLLLRHLLGDPAPALARSPVTLAAAGTIDYALHLTGQATIPMSALIVGARMAGLQAEHLLTRLMAGTVLLRLAVIPAAATALLLALPFPLEMRTVLLIVAAQPCSMASVTLAEAYDADAGFAAASVLLTHAAALLTIPLWLAAPWWR